MVCAPCLAVAASTGPVAPIALAVTGTYALLNNKKSKKRNTKRNTKRNKRKLKKRKSKKRKSKRKRKSIK